MRMKKIYTVVFGLLLAMNAFSQTELVVPPIPAMRVLHHENIINSLNTIAKLNRKTDKVLPFTQNDALNLEIDKSIRTRVNNFRAGIELNKNLDENAKFKWLRGVNEMLTGFISAYQAKIVKAGLLPGLVKAYDDAMQMELAGNSIAEVIAENEIETGNILLENFALKENKGVPAARDILVLKACQRNPESILRILTKYPNNRYADSLIILSAFRNQEELYSFAAVPNALGKKIQSVDHPLVKIIGRLALTKTGRMYFPFLDNLYHKKITIDSITPLVVKESSKGYYSLLVNTRIDYAERMQHGDTPMAAKVLTDRLKSKAIELYINEINALHEEHNENIRFKKLEELNAQELYYLAVLGEEEIYTSSFVSGVYPRIFHKMDVPRSDSLLMFLHNDYYKKFIKMCASYNTLDNFLSRMDKSTAQNLMRSFVSGLENTKTLEDAVDVADSYGSIKNPDLLNSMLRYVSDNETRCKTNHNQSRYTR